MTTLDTPVLDIGISESGRKEIAAGQVTADLLTQRMQVHEKTSWMLRSLLK